ncbi:type I restriction endonuclease subunit R, partial [Klebsiella pneumoniae]|nr:type I restriction endonuclease subunit R [Klebsiella pneumoniae]
MLEKERLIRIIRDFILFQESTTDEKDSDGNKIGELKTTIKILASYHQYFAVQKAIDNTKIAVSEQGDRKIGVVWH